MGTRTTKRVIIEGAIAGAIGGIFGVVVQKLLFGSTKSLAIAVVTAVVFDLSWFAIRRRVRLPREASEPATSSALATDAPSAKAPPDDAE